MSAKPSVLFVCIHNAGRSQMAAGFLSALAGDSIEVRSAGSAPAIATTSAGTGGPCARGCPVRDRSVGAGTRRPRLRRAAALGAGRASGR